MDRATGWELTDIDLLNLTAVGTSILYDAEGSALLQTTSAGSYKGGYKVWNYDPSYEYMIDYDVTVFRGTHSIGFTDSYQGTLRAYTGTITTSQHVNFIFHSENYMLNYMRIFCTFGNSANGSCMISNFKMYRRLLS